MYGVPLRQCKEHELILTWLCPHSLYVSADDDDEDVKTLHCLIAVLFLLIVDVAHATKLKQQVLHFKQVASPILCVLNKMALI